MASNPRVMVRVRRASSWSSARPTGHLLSLSPLALGSFPFGFGKAYLSVRLLGPMPSIPPFVVREGSTAR
eukprot:273266-Amorphochlora_amoeboformis.AAC.2